MVSLKMGGVLGLGLLAWLLHLVSVALAKALRTYSRSRLEDLCATHGHPARADQVAHLDEPTERSAEVMAVATGLALAAWLGVTAGRIASHLTVVTVVAITFAVGASGYVLAGVIGRVFAESVIDTVWPAAGVLRVLTGPLTFALRLIEELAFRIAHPDDATPRPSSVEVEIPPGDHPAVVEADLPESTRELLQRAVELTRRDVSEIMTPHSAIVALPWSVSARVAARIFRETGKSRIPLFGENRDDIIGILYAKDLFHRMTDADRPDAVIPRKLVRNAYCVPETKNALELLEEFRSSRTQIAIVLDEYGGVAGLVTLEDLLEELVGTIDDEHDIPPEDPVVPLGDARYEVDATLSIELLNERLHLRLPTDSDFLTVGGLAFHALGRLPEPGASFRYHGLEFTILEVADHSIRRVRLDLQPAAPVGSQ